MLENEDEQKIEEYLTLDFYFYSNVMYLFFISKNSCFTDVLKKTLKKKISRLPYILQVFQNYKTKT